METLKTIASILGSVAAIGGFIIGACKPLRQWFVNKILAKQKTAQNEEASKQILAIIKELREQLNNQKNALQCTLRSDITKTYYTYKDEKAFPIYIKESLVKSHEAYEKLDGNSFISDICEEMKDWETYR